MSAKMNPRDPAYLDAALEAGRTAKGCSCDWHRERDELTATVERHKAALREIAPFSNQAGLIARMALAADTQERFCVCGFSTTETLMPEHDHRHVVNEHQRGWAEHAEMCLAADTPEAETPDRCPTCGMGREVAASADWWGLSGCNDPWHSPPPETKR